VASPVFRVGGHCFGVVKLPEIGKKWHDRMTLFQFQFYRAICTPYYECYSQQYVSTFLSVTDDQFEFVDSYNVFSKCHKGTHTTCNLNFCRLLTSLQAFNCVNVLD